MKGCPARAPDGGSGKSRVRGHFHHRVSDWTAGNWLRSSEQRPVCLHSRHPASTGRDWGLPPRRPPSATVAQPLVGSWPEALDILSRVRWVLEDDVAPWQTGVSLWEKEPHHSFVPVCGSHCSPGLIQEATWVGRGGGRVQELTCQETTAGLGFYLLCWLASLLAPGHSS